MRWRPAHNSAHKFDLRLAQNKGLEFWQTEKTIFLYDSMPADCLVKVVKRNLEEREAEILYDAEQPEDKEVRRVILKESSSEKVGKDLRTQREDLFRKHTLNKMNINKHLFVSYGIRQQDNVAG